MPFAIEGEKFLHEASLLTLLQLSSSQVIFYSDFISKGKITIKGGLLNGVVDYGNNDCDNNYTYTHENGMVYNLMM